MNITQNTVALVTGGGSGLGEATARRLHDAGAGVVIVDLPSSKGEALAAELGERARFVATDVRDEDAVQAAVDAARELGDLRVAVTCAGIGTPGRIVGRNGPASLDAFATVIRVNLIGSFNLMRLVAAGAQPVAADEVLVARVDLDAPRKA